MADLTEFELRFRVFQGAGTHNTILTTILMLVLSKVVSLGSVLTLTHSSLSCASYLPRRDQSRDREVSRCDGVFAVCSHLSRGSQGPLMWGRGGLNVGSYRRFSLQPSTTETAPKHPFPVVQNAGALKGQ